MANGSRVVNMELSELIIKGIPKEPALYNRKMAHFQGQIATVMNKSDTYLDLRIK
jgi:hypothetical protein